MIKFVTKAIFNDALDLAAFFGTYVACALLDFKSFAFRL